MNDSPAPDSRGASPDGDADERVYRSRVPLPQGAERPFEVFVNGVPQREGDDYDVKGQDMFFFAGIRREGKLGFIRWLSITLAIAGTYRQNDSVDVTFNRDGRRLVETGLPIEVLVEDEAHKGPARGSYSPG